MKSVYGILELMFTFLLHFSFSRLFDEIYINYRDVVFVLVYELIKYMVKFISFALILRHIISVTGWEIPLLFDDQSSINVRKIKIGNYLDDEHR